MKVPVSILIVIVSAVLVWNVSREARDPRLLVEGVSIDELLSPGFWQGLMREHGVEAARAEYLRVSHESGLAVGVRHATAHAFSYALYEEEGAEGLRYCGDEHVFGCIHGMMGRIFVESGGAEDVIRQCAAHPEPVECEHGLGHGFLALRDYTLDDLGAAMAMCERSASSREIQGCSWGVVMEWYYQTMSGELIREPTDSEAFALCDRFDGYARTGCIYNMPSLWAHETPYGARSAETIRYIAERCSALLAQQDREDCAQGTGRMIAAFASIPRDAREPLCASAFGESVLVERCQQTIPLYEDAESSR